MAVSVGSKLGAALRWLGLLVPPSAGCVALVNVDDYRFDRPTGVGGGGGQGGAISTGGSGAEGPGSCIWQKRAGDDAPQDGFSVHVNGSNEALLTGWFEGTIDLGCGPLGSAGLGDVWLAALDANGDCVWSASYGDAGDQIGNAVSADGDDDVLLTGHFTGQLELGCGALSGASDYTWDLFVAKLSPSGACLWSKRAGDATNESGWGISADSAGSVLLAGDFEDTLDLGASCTALVSGGGLDLFVAKLDPDGNCLWCKRAGDAGEQSAYWVRPDSGDDVVVAGYFEGSIDLGCGPLVSAGGSDAFVAKLDPDGNCLWSQRAGAANNQAVWGMTVDRSDNVLLTGFLTETLDFGCGGLVSAGGTDIFVAKLDPGGNCLWSNRAGGASDQYAMGIAADPAGNVLVAGYFDGSLDLGCEPLVGQGAFDLMVAKLDPDGNCVWSRSAGDATELQRSNAIAADAAGNALVAADFVGSVDLGCEPVTSAGDFDLLIAKLAR